MIHGSDFPLPPASTLFFGTGVLQMGMLFYLKYSLKVDESLASVILGIAFLVAMLSLYPWGNWVANKLDSRRTLMLANAVMILGIIPMGFSPSIIFTYITAVIIGIGLGGLVLIGDVIMTEVVDEDEVKTGHQRAGMYFGMSGFLITLSGLLVSTIFGLMMPASGYDTLLNEKDGAGTDKTVGFCRSIKDGGKLNP